MERDRTLFTDHRGEWTAHPTAWGFLVRSPYGEPLRVAATWEEALEAALQAKEVYDEMDELIRASLPLSLEDLQEDELEENPEEDR